MKMKQTINRSPCKVSTSTLQTKSYTKLVRGSTQTYTLYIGLATFEALVTVSCFRLCRGQITQATKHTSRKLVKICCLDTNSRHIQTKRGTTFFPYLSGVIVHHCRHLHSSVRVNMVSVRTTQSRGSTSSNITKSNLRKTWNAFVLLESLDFY